MATEDYFARLSPPQGPGIVVQPAQGPAMPRLDTGATAVAEALVGAGKVVEDIGVKWANATDHIGANLALTDFAQKANALEHGSSQDPNYFIAPDKLKIGLEDAKRQALEMVRDPVRRSDLDRVLTGRIISSMNHASNASRSRAIEGARGAADALDQDMLAQVVKNQGNEVAQTSIINERFKGIDADVKAGIYTAHAGEERKRKLNHETSAAMVMYATRNDPAGTAEKLKDPANYPGLTPTQREVAINGAVGLQQQNVMDTFRVQGERNDPVVRSIVETATRPQEPADLVTPGNVSPFELGTGTPYTIQRDGNSVIVPGVDANGRRLTREQAEADYDRTGRQVGVYASPEGAATYTSQLQANQELLKNTPQGKALMSLPQHMQFRTIESTKQALNQADAQARTDADRAAAFSRDTNNMVETIKNGGKLTPEVVTRELNLQRASCARGRMDACKYVTELENQIELQPHIDAAWQLDETRLGVAVAQMRGVLSTAGANPTSAQFKALHAFEGVQREMSRIMKEEPIALGQKTGLFRIGDVDLAAAAAGDPAAIAALGDRGQQSEAIRRRNGGTGSPWQVSELPQLKQQWDAADAAGKYKILAALRTTMPSVETYTGAVSAIGGDSFSSANMSNIIRRDPELAKQIVLGGVILATDENAREKAKDIRSELLGYVGGDIYIGPEQTRQAIDLALNLDAARRRTAGKLYEQGSVEGLKQAWKDVNGPIEIINNRRTPITPAITPGNFAGALQRLDERDVLRMGGAYDRSGRPVTAQELADNAVLVPTEPGSSLYYVGQNRPTTEAPDGFGQFFDIEGRPLKIDMGYLATRHPVQPGIFTTTPPRPPRTPREQGPAQRFSDADFDQAVLADLHTQFPNDTPAQLQQRLAAVNESMDKSRAQFYPQVPGFNPEAFETAVREGYGGFGYEPTGGFIDLREGAKKK